jgi:hypothetical protein
MMFHLSAARMSRHAKRARPVRFTVAFQARSGIPYTFLRDFHPNAIVQPLPNLPESTLNLGQKG